MENTRVADDNTGNDAEDPEMMGTEKKAEMSDIVQDNRDTDQSGELS